MSGIFTVFVPKDAAALAVGADEVAQAIASHAAQAGLQVQVRRTGSRGLLWLEPLVEVQTPQGRIGYGPVEVSDVPSLVEAGFLEGSPHPLCLGPVEELPWMKRQQRLSFARCGVIDPLSLEDHARLGGFAGWQRAQQMAPAEIVEAVAESGLRGRGGAAFPAGIKWRTVAQTTGPRKAVVCNADEGDSGTFADRLLMEGDPLLLVEGMAISARAVGADEGYIYVRSEYPHAARTLEEAIALARQAGVVGGGFELQVRLGAGSYVCGEETALLESLEGKRGMVRSKPPVPAVSGLFGRPTLVHNVLSFAAVPTILAQGPAFYRDFGTGRSRGTLAVQLAGNVRRGGLFELPFGITLREVVFELGGGTASGRPVKAIQVGGPLGAYVAPSRWDEPLDYEAYAAFGGVLGHGGIVVHDDTADLARLARFAFEFCAVESCGKCTPCRIGSVRGAETIDRLLASSDKQAPVRLLRDLCDTMLHGSLCAMGGMTPYPVLSALENYPQDFGIPT